MASLVNTTVYVIVHKWERGEVEALTQCSGEFKYKDRAVAECKRRGGAEKGFYVYEITSNVRQLEEYEE